VRPTASGVLLVGFTGPTLPGWLRERLEQGLAGVCLFGSNVVSHAQLRGLTDAIRAANPRALVAVDEEGGDVTRLHHDRGSPYPGNAVLGRIDDTAYTRSVAAAVGAELRAAGCRVDLAPDADVNSNPENPVIGARSFGVDPEAVARHVAAWVRGLQQTGVAATAKHFPGHGDTAQDSHLAVPVVDAPLEVLRARELVPFQAAIEAGVALIMTSHIVLQQVDAAAPATFSRPILQGLLRDELGFQGVIVSDALDMHGASGANGLADAAVRALAAGCDLLCLGSEKTEADVAAIESAIDAALASGALAPGRLAEASSRVSGLARSLADPDDRDGPGGDAGAGDRDEAAARGAGGPTDPGGEPAFDLARTVAAFEIRPGIRIERERQLVVLDTVANIAIGSSPWGPAAAGAAVVRIDERDPRLPDGSAQPVLVGRDNHRHAWVRTLVDEARRRHPSTVVVDMGWPAPGGAYADIATFGASRHVGQALLQWLSAKAGAERTDAQCG